MSDSTALGDRMKRHEAAYRVLLPRRTYGLIRLDIRAAHSYLRGATRPYDLEFMADMDAVAEALCQEITGTAFAYTQSDEISLLVTDFATEQTEPWFEGVVAKQLTIAASLATAVLNERRPGRRALFDARLFTLSDPVEVANYFLWRQRDAVRNSISMAAQAQFSHRRLHGVSSKGMQELLWTETRINWNDYPGGCKRGRTAVRHTGERETTYTDKRTQEQQTVLAIRSWWQSNAAPHFTTRPDQWLARAIPVLPRLASSD
ncbi:tRNA(His) guanylyltransferase Thg1 family protein [Streptomyces sp. NPDC051320]|uniref:tRNA(His) guanylyltransferase Thg1 family protein n=1 Tax=Streptomyces sp. NPDC051320 TaxID=3154644 RepID=UPI0034134898